MSTWKVLPLTTLVFWSSCAGQIPKSSPELSIAGAWQVDEVLCSGCRGPVLKEKGKTLVFAHDHIENPIAGNCSDAPGYTHLTAQSARKIIAENRAALPRDAKRRLADAGRALYGFITCGGMNYAQIAAPSDTILLYFGEDQVVFQLSRKRRN